MTIEKTNKLKTFLSIKKTTIYIGLALIGLILKLLNQTGNIVILTSLGLFLGHISYRCVKFPKNKILKIMSMLIVIFLICIILFYNFNILPATILLLIALGLSLIIELRPKFTATNQIE